VSTVKGTFWLGLKRFICHVPPGSVRAVNAEDEVAPRVTDLVLKFKREPQLSHGLVV
jgi:hypothetical protein